MNKVIERNKIRNMKYEVESRPWGMYEVLLDAPE